MINAGIIDQIKEEVKRQAALEESFNSMAIPSPIFKLAFRFNNYRRQVKVKTKTSKEISAIKGAIDSTNKLQISKHTKIITVKDYHRQIMLQYGKNFLTGIFCQNIINGNKETWSVEGYTVKQIHHWLDVKTKEIQQRIDNALYDFIRQFNLKIRFENPRWQRKELEIKGDKFIDSLPRECIVHCKVGKKVYDSGFEFNDELYASNYIESRAIEKVSPDIVRELNKIHNKLERSDYQVIKDAINECKDIEEMLKDSIINARMKALSPDEKQVIENQVFNKFSTS